MAGDLFDRVEGGIDGAIAMGGDRVIGAVHGEGHGRLLRARGAADHAQRFKDIVVMSRIFARLHEGDEILVEHLFFAVGEILEPDKDILELVIAQLVAQIIELGPQRGAARVFAQGQRAFGKADIGRAHNLERFGVFEHAVLVDAAFVGEGVFADDRLVILHGKARRMGDLAADPDQFGCIDACVIGHDVVAHFERHDDFFEGGVAGALAQTIDRAFDLTCPAGDCGQCIGRRHAQIIVAMGGKDHIIGAWHGLDQAFDQIGTLDRGGVADGIGDVDRRRACLDRDFNHAAQVIPFRACGIHRRPLHIVA